VRVTYDPSVDTAYVYFREIESGGAKQTVSLDVLDGPENLVYLTLDFDDEERVIGIEVLNASDVLPPELLRQAEPPDRH
jgi:uncharacterized protein YuzE